MPALDDATEAALRASIAANGILVPVIRDQYDRILDGHHRARIAGDLAISYPTERITVADDAQAVELARTLNLDRRHLTPAVRRVLARDLAAQGHSTRAIAGALGVSKGTVHNETSGAQDWAPESGATTGLDGKRYPRPIAFELPAASFAESDPGFELRPQRKEPAPVRPAPPVPRGKFATLVADPPWRYANTRTRAAAAGHYPTMTVAQVCALTPPAADDAHCYLWVTNGFLREGFEVLDAWGFDYKTTLTWCKPQIGLGNYFRNATEHVLFGVRGRLDLLRRDTPTWFEARRAGHSAKPPEFYDLVMACSPGPRLELFARTPRKGWKAWGNEL